MICMDQSLSVVARVLDLVSQAPVKVWAQGWGPSWDLGLRVLSQALEVLGGFTSLQLSLVWAVPPRAAGTVFFDPCLSLKGNFDKAGHLL